MNIRKTILTSLILAVMGLFLAGCGCDGECPIKKMFGVKSAESKSPCDTATPSTEADMK